VEDDFGLGFGVASMRAGVGFGRGLKKMLSHPFFFGFAGSIVACAVASSNVPWTIVPETRLEIL